MGKAKPLVTKAGLTKTPTAYAKGGKLKSRKKSKS